ncbi:MAG: hypothetical protein C5B43_01460 [Verrucomicrobia bacterium]|nr:MAG: hypothetical protein C5B43_01460 [Verrucomicrobiota bacterium]
MWNIGKPIQGAQNNKAQNIQRTTTQEPSMEQSEGIMLFKGTMTNKKIAWLKDAKDSWITFIRGAFFNSKLTLGEIFTIIFDKTTRNQLIDEVIQLQEFHLANAIENLRKEIEYSNLPDSLDQNKEMLKTYIDKALKALTFDSDTCKELENIKKNIPKMESNTVVKLWDEQAQDLVKKAEKLSNLLY